MLSRMFLAALLVFSACGDGRVALTRGPVGPASYLVDVSVDGAATVAGSDVEAEMTIRPTDQGADLKLTLSDGTELSAALKRTGERLTLEAVSGVPARFAGEADLATLTSQLEPPLPNKRVGVGDRWESRRIVETATVNLNVLSKLAVVGISLEDGKDVVEVEGRVTGTMTVFGVGSTAKGSVTGKTRFAWIPSLGRLSSSYTELRWTVPGVGDLNVRSSVQPA